MIVDCHVNTWKDEHVHPEFQARLKRLLPTTGSTRGLPDRLVKAKADADTLYQGLAGADHAIVFTLRYGDTMGVEGDDETTAEAVAKYPHKFVGFAYVDPRRPDCMELLCHAVEDLGLQGVKYGPIYNGVPLDDPRLTPVYDYLVKNDLPLTMHMGVTYTPLYSQDLGWPISVERLAVRYPDLKIIMAHLAHPWYDDCVVTVRRQPNVYAEVSGIMLRPWKFYGAMMSVQEYSIADKIFFGSDFPFVELEDSLEPIRSVNKIVEGTALPRVSSEVIEQIIYSNPFEHWWHGKPPI